MGSRIASSPPTLNQRFVNERIKAAVSVFNITMETLCESLPKSCRTFQRYRHTTMPLDFIRHIANFFGMRFEDFINPSLMVFLAALEHARTRRQSAAATEVTPFLVAERHPYDWPAVLQVYTPETIGNFHHFQSVYFHPLTYGTNRSAYRVMADDTVQRIRDHLRKKRLFLISGNAGQGKTFLFSGFVGELVKDYDLLLYYSPRLNPAEPLRFETLFESLRTHLSLRRRILLVLDDGHLIFQGMKQALFSLLHHHTSHALLHLLLISRQQERWLPEDTLAPSLRYHVNAVVAEIAEGIWERGKASLAPHWSDTLALNIRQELCGSNLMWLTLLLQTWEAVSRRSEVPSFTQIRQEAYQDFLHYDTLNHSDGWRQIHQIIAALFQYRIPIDHRYLSAANPCLPAEDIADYLADYWVYPLRFPPLTDCPPSESKLAARYCLHPQIPTPEFILLPRHYQQPSNRIRYYFQEMETGTEEQRMAGAEEFRWYLQAYDNQLTFGTHHHLDRLTFTKLVLKQYLLFETDLCKCNTVYNAIIAADDEQESAKLLDFFFTDQALRPIMRKTILTKAFDDQLHYIFPYYLETCSPHGCDKKGWHKVHQRMEGLRSERESLTFPASPLNCDLSIDNR